MKVILSFLIFLLLAAPAFAQSSYHIKGYVIDPAENLKMENTSIAILHAKDSTLVTFTRATADGNFTINQLKSGNLILLATYPGYADYVEHFKLDSMNPGIDFGLINMTLKARLLQEVVVKGQTDAIKIKGDTTEYNAAAFVIQPNAKVEDLLKQFPGIQVDKDGKITAQGQTVTKVLVDGEEFFGDDPTLVTKNLRADMVDKVQLYDKKSDQAAFTGIDDGIKDKTLNIKLKEDKKNGYFGKIEVGGATDYNEQQAMLNVFSAKQKFSVYATHSNTAKTSLSWQDNNRFNTGGGRDDISYNGEGLPETSSAAAHYDTKWNQNKQSININYKIGSIDVSGFKNTLNQNNLPIGVLFSNTNQNFSNRMFRQKLDATYKLKIDSTSDLKISVDGTLRNNGYHNDDKARTQSSENILKNSSTRLWDDDTEQQNFSGNIFWSKKLKKKGRTLSLNINASSNDSNSEAYLNSLNEFYNPELNTDGSSILDSVVNIDQLKLNNSDNKIFNTNATYTEPLSKRLALVFNYGIDMNKGISDRQSFNKALNGSYTDFDQEFSNNFELKQFAHQTGAIFNYNKEKVILNFGSKLSFVNFAQTDLYTDSNFSRNFINLNPQVNFSYNFSQQKRLRLDYNGSNTQPSINQIQPVRSNTDPLNIYLGNPDLKPAFNNRFNINYNNYKVMSNSYFYLGASYNFTSNAIVDSRTTDTAGVSRYKSVNLHDKAPSNYWLYASYSQQVKALLGINVGINLQTNGNTYFSYINDELNRTISNSYVPQLSISKHAVKKYEFYVNFGPSYNTSQSSLQKELNNNGWGWSGYGSIGLYLPGKIRIATNANYTYQPKTVSFNQDFEQLLLNASLDKKFTKKENLTLSLSGRDLLNQNTGFRRSAYGNAITQTSYNTIRRYFMLSVIWDFNKMGGIKTTPAKEN